MNLPLLASLAYSRVRFTHALYALCVLAALLSASAVHAQLQLGSDVDGEAAGDRAGTSVALSADGQRLAIGAINSSGGGAQAGRVRVFDLIAGTWQQVGAGIDGEAPGDQSGWSVALSANGQRLAIGAVGNDGSGSSAGHVRTYDLVAGVWQQVGADIDGESSGDQSGYSVALSADGQRIAVGAPGNDGAGTSAGHVRLYDFVAGAWQQVGSDLDGEAASDLSGSAVALSANGQRLAVGAPLNDGAGNASGQVRVYDFVAGAWQQTGADIDGEAANDISGNSIALSADGQRVAIGAYNNNGGGTDAGHVRVYEYVSGAWQQVGVDIDGEAAGDRSGSSVALSGDGSRVAIGAILNDGAGSSAGHVRVYDLVAGVWQQVGSDIDGESFSDQSGYSAALSSNGQSLAIGAPTNGGNGADAGHVRVFDVSPAALPVTLTTFTATPADGHVDLAWATATERGSAGFAVERSGDGLRWTELAWVPSSIEPNGDSDRQRTYAHRDAEPLPGANYYRLRQRDRDGAEDLTQVVVAYVGEAPTSLTDLTVFPNPARGVLEIVGLPVADRGQVTPTVDLVGPDGRRVATLSEAAAGPRARLRLDGVPAGVYTLVVRSNQATATRRVVVAE